MSFFWAAGIEDTFVAQTAPGQRGLDEYELQQHYRFWQNDIDMAADIGFEVMRYGVPWYRIEPEPGHFDWSWTDGVIPYLAEKRIDPIIDLVHYGTPLWLEGQFGHPDYPRRVAVYAEAFAARYRDFVRSYTPVNEPVVTGLICGHYGRWPPYLEGDEGFVRIIDALGRGIVYTVEALRSVRTDAAIIYVEGTGFWVTETDGEPEPPTLESARLLTSLELLLGRIKPDHFLYGFLTDNGMSEGDLEWYADNRINIDCLGINYYPDGSVHRRRTDAPGGIVPFWGGTEFLHRAVSVFSRLYDVPIFVSECAVNERSREAFDLRLPMENKSSPSALREWWLEQVVEAITSMLAEGLPLVGFTWWPLLDTAGWDYRDGSRPVQDYLEPGGLIGLHPDEEGTLRREELPVGRQMSRLIKAGAP